MKETTKILSFGSMVLILGSDFIREVSQAPSDVWVVVTQYKEGISDYGLLMQSIEELVFTHLLLLRANST
ncbi:unnamed protein product [Lupinus luteus]|uniref:Uncharacterized protein n=1 Tax=Lupinus luteus TaxID=3873 RepID=A0AAV1YQL0_LUPLU